MTKPYEVKLAFTWKSVVVWRTPDVQHISRMECMASCGAPRSRTAIPKRAAKIGPIVVPHGLSFLTITSCGRRSRKIFYLYSAFPHAQGRFTKNTCQIKFKGILSLITLTSFKTPKTFIHLQNTSEDIYFWGNSRDSCPSATLKLQKVHKQIIKKNKSIWIERFSPHFLKARSLYDEQIAFKYLYHYPFHTERRVIYITVNCVYCTNRVYGGKISSTLFLSFFFLFLTLLFMNPHMVLKRNGILMIYTNINKHSK